MSFSVHRVVLARAMAMLAVGTLSILKNCPKRRQNRFLRAVSLQRGGYFINLAHALLQTVDIFVRASSAVVVAAEKDFLLRGPEKLTATSLTTDLAHHEPPIQ